MSPKKEQKAPITLPNLLYREKVHVCDVCGGLLLVFKVLIVRCNCTYMLVLQNANGGAVPINRIN